MAYLIFSCGIGEVDISEVNGPLQGMVGDLISTAQWDLKPQVDVLKTQHRIYIH